MQIAIAYGNGTDEVALWANVVSEDKSGTIFFEVINGAWAGYITEDGYLVCDETKEGFDAKIVWRGAAPFGAYEDAIPWIEAQIANTPGTDDYWGA